MRTTMIEQPRFDERFEALMERGRVERLAERFAEAAAVFAEAEGLAEHLEDYRAADRACVNRCTVLLDFNRELSGDLFDRLRAMLMASADGVNCRMAAYNLARAYECAKQYRKCLFYARIALDRSRVLGSADWIASSHNQIGNCLLAESRFQDARAEYELALKLLPDGPSARKALILTNLGYALVILGAGNGASLIYESLRMLRRLHARHDQLFPHLDLSYALLERGAYRYALAHSAKALALAEEAGYEEPIRQALYLLGEAAQQAGDSRGAREYFHRLQERYFPGSPHLTGLLLAVDVLKLVNLKA